jgi:hypothetical protein
MGYKAQIIRHPLGEDVVADWFCIDQFDPEIPFSDFDPVCDHLVENAVPAPIVAVDQTGSGLVNFFVGSALEKGVVADDIALLGSGNA